MMRLSGLLILLMLVAGFSVYGVEKTHKRKAKAKISFTTIKHDFGTINESDGQVEYDFVFTNTGGRPLVILKTSTSCECTLAKHTKEGVAPGRKGKIKVIYSPIGVRGNFMKNIYVYSNGSKHPITLYIKGKIKPVGR